MVALEKQVNAQGGINGRPLQFKFYDNQSSPSVAVSVASPLLSRYPVIIDGMLTTTDTPVDDLVGANGPVIYDLSPGDHPARGSYVFSAYPSTTAMVQAFVNFARAKGWTRVGAITSTDASGVDGWNNIQKAVDATKGGLTITDHETFNPTATSVTTQLSKIASTHPQALFMWTTGTPAGTVFKGLQEVGQTQIPVFSTGGNESYAEMTKLSNVLPAQLYFPSPAYQVQPVSLLPAKQRPAEQQFDSALASAGVKVPDAGDALGWDPGLIIVDALRHLGTNATASQIRKYILNISSFVGVDGTYNFTSASVAPDNRGIGLQALRITEWTSTKHNWTTISGPGGNLK